MGILDYFNSILFQKAKETRLLILGLDNAGKTSIIRSLCSEELLSVSPTVGFQIKSITYRNIICNIWDVGGQATLRPFWRNYYEAVNALVEFFKHIYFSFNNLL